MNTSTLTRLNRLSGKLLALTALFLAALGSTLAHAETFDDFPTSPPPTERGDYGTHNPGSIGPGTNVGSPTATASPAEPGRPAAAPSAKRPKPGTGGAKATKSKRTRRCRSRESGGRRARTCTTYFNGRAVKRCTTKRRNGRPRTRCRAVAQRISGKHGAQSARLNSQFYTSPTIASVGRLYPARCTATMLTRTIAVTAAHCLWKNGAYHQNVSIFPGMTYGSANTEETAQKPFGQWTAYNWWVPDGYKRGDAGLDFGLVEFRQTTADGRYLGDVVGTWGLHWNLQWNTGARIQGIGYPAEGHWATATGHWGVGQYACDSNWDGDWARLSNISASNTAFLYTECTMNGGSSGGPWFVQLADGSWTIGAIQARGGCYTNMTSSTGRCVPYARHALAPYLDDRFGQFWHSIVG